LGKIGLLVVLGVVGLAGVLTVPAVHWHIVGWARREPFYAGRPASYWRAEVAECQVVRGWLTSFFGTPAGPCSVILLRPANPVVKAKRRVEAWLGVGPALPLLIEPLPDFDREAVPVLASLLDDPNAKVRWFAAMRLGDIGPDALAAVPALREAVDDPAEVFEGDTVGKAARKAVERIDPKD
jgi:hypothetical protein